MGNDTAVGAARLLSEPPQVIHRHSYFSPTLRQRFAILLGNGSGNIFASPLQFIGYSLQICPVGLGRELTPVLKGSMSVSHGLGYTGSVHGRDLRKGLARGRVHDGERGGRTYPLAIKVEWTALHAFSPFPVLRRSPQGEHRSNPAA
jgi:hypothetical protein